MNNKTTTEYWLKQSASFEQASEYAAIHTYNLSRVQCWNRGKEAAKAKCQQQKAELMMKHDQEMQQLKLNHSLEIESMNTKIQDIRDANSSVEKLHNDEITLYEDTEIKQHTKIRSLQRDTEALKRTIKLLMAGE